MPMAGEDRDHVGEIDLARRPVGFQLVYIFPKQSRIEGYTPVLISRIASCSGVPAFCSTMAATRPDSSRRMRP